MDWAFRNKYVGAVVSPNGTEKVDKAGRYYIINFSPQSPQILCVPVEQYETTKKYLNLDALVQESEHLNLLVLVQQSETANLHPGQQTPGHDQAGQDYILYKAQSL